LLGSYAATQPSNGKELPWAPPADCLFIGQFLGRPVNGIRNDFSEGQHPCLGVYPNILVCPGLLATAFPQGQRHPHPCLFLPLGDGRRLQSPRVFELVHQLVVYVPHLGRIRFLRARHVWLPASGISRQLFVVGLRTGTVGRYNLANHVVLPHILYNYNFAISGSYPAEHHT
jgi:hypothetical protein